MATARKTASAKTGPRASGGKMAGSATGLTTAPIDATPVPARGTPAVKKASRAAATPSAPAEVKRRPSPDGASAVPSMPPMPPVSRKRTSAKVAQADALAGDAAAREASTSGVVAGEALTGRKGAGKAPTSKVAANKARASKALAREVSANKAPASKTAPSKAPAGKDASDETTGRIAADAVTDAVGEDAARLGDVALPDGAVVHRGRALPDDVRDESSDAARAGADAAVDDAVDPAAVAAVAVQIADLVPTVVRPEYWERACADLMKRDRILKKLIPQFGPVHLKARGDPFVTLARSIIGQQISVKAAQSVWERVLAACPDIVPAAVVALGYDRLAACGLSRRKAEYILDLGQHFVGGALHVDRWAAMDDEDVIEELTRIRGIGRWTAEMFLIFNLMRPDVLPLDDLGLIKAISVNYFSGEPVTRSEAREVAANWEPWRTVATWYMWRSLEPVPVVY